MKSKVSWVNPSGILLLRFRTHAQVMEALSEKKDILVRMCDRVPGGKTGEKFIKSYLHKIMAFSRYTRYFPKVTTTPHR